MIGSTFLKLLPTAHLHLRRDLSPETSKNTYPVSDTRLHPLSRRRFPRTNTSQKQRLFFGSCSTCCGWGARQATCTCFHSCSRGRVQMHTGLGRIRKGKCKKTNENGKLGTSIHSTSSLSLFCPSLCFRELCLQRLNTSPKGCFGRFWTHPCFC